MSSPDPQSAPQPTAGAARYEPLLILLLVVLGYVLGQGRLPLIGEETCRGLHGIEMARSGDWLLPTNQGVVILDRPPLQYWLLALVHRFVHPVDPLTLRLSSAAIVFLTALTIWSYARRALPGVGALVAGLAYPTIGHISDLGRRAETDGLFAWLLGAALLAWHHGYAQRWRPLWTWTASGLVIALATLAKGAQAPIAFFGTVYLFLLLRRQSRMLLSTGHLAGLLVFLAGVAAFQVPFHLVAGWEGTRQTWLDPLTNRAATDVVRMAMHLVEFPWKVLVATLPWSLLAMGVLHPGFWRAPERVRSSSVFALLGCATIFVPVWISEGGLGRYVIGCYPLFAVVCGAVAQRALESDAPALLRRLWNGYLRFFAWILLALSLALLGISLASGPAATETLIRLAQPGWLLALLIVLSALNLALVAWRRWLVPARWQVFSLAALLAVVFNGPGVNIRAYNCHRVEAEVAALRERLPDDAQLVSFNFLHHKFLYHWYLGGDSIPIVDWPRRRSQVPGELEYFAVAVRKGQPFQLPFDWDEIARIDMDPKRPNQTLVIVGRKRASD